MNKNILKILGVILLIIIIILIIPKNNKDKDKNRLENYINNSIIENNNDKKEMDNNLNKENNIAVLHTNFGDISFELSKDKPLTTNNFIKLVKEGFYNGVKFHRVIKDFMIQTGDPLSKDDTQQNLWGTGGPGYKFEDELTGNEKYEIGTVAMANSGPNTNGSQFFIMTSNTPLPPNYTVFGKVISGIDIAMKIQDVKTDINDRPISQIVINSIDMK